MDFIRLKRMIADEPIDLTILKSKFNLCATRLNRLGESLPLNEKEALLAQINSLSHLINEYEQ